MKKLRKILSLILAMLMLLCLFAGCGSDSSDNSGGDADSSSDSSASNDGTVKSTKDTMIVATSSDPHSLLPLTNGSRQFGRIADCVYEMLVETAADGSVKPWVAKDWDLGDDGITFYLNEGVKFQDGTDCDAEAVVWNMKKWGESDSVTASMTYCHWDEAEAIDDLTVFLPYDYYCYEAVINMGSTNFMLMSPDAYEADPDGFALNPVGTGPFIISEWVLDDHVTLDRWDGYWGGRDIYLNQIIFRFIPESSQQLIELETGGVDLICDVPLVSWDSIESNSDLSIHQFETVTIDAIHFNCLDEIWGNEKVRQAAAYAINLKEIWEGAYYGLSEPAFQACGKDMFGYDPSYEYENWPYEWDNSNEEKCRELLAEAGYPDGIEANILIDTDANRVAVAEILRNQLSKCGINATVTSTDYATAQADIYAANYDICLNGSVCNGSISKVLYERFAAALSYPGSFSYCKWNEPTLDELLMQASQSEDEDERMECYKECQALYTEQVPSVAYWDRIQVTATVNNLKGDYGYIDSFMLAYCYFE